ncbi:hypothetical protein GINT2_000386 [Glugoides intestinalis]
MESLELINNERIKHGYITNHFKTYNKFCKSMKRKLHNIEPSTYLLYTLESNLAKFKMCNSITFLYKNKRLLKNEQTAFSKLYLEYTECFIDNKKSVVNIDRLIELRHQLADYYSFLDDVYQLADNRHDFEEYKVKYVWNDITIVFETKKILDSFLDQTFCFNDFRFNTQLALKIILISKSKESLLHCLRGSSSNHSQTDDNQAVLLKVFKATSELHAAVCDLERFLKDNFVDSAYISQFNNSTEKVLSFIKRMMEYSNGNINLDIDSFKTPIYFEDVAEYLEELKHAKKINPKKLRSLLLDIVEKRLQVPEENVKMPFFPVFYDIANDYISYSSIDNSVAEILQKFHFSSKS